MDARLTEIDEAEVLRFLGCPPTAAALPIAEAAAMLMEVATPRLIWRKFPLNEETSCFIVGHDLHEHLSGCREIVLFAVTLGMEVESLLHRMQKRDMAQAVLLDACASSAIENVCDNFCADLSRKLAPSFLTRRFSPGYGDLPLSQQRIIFHALNVTRRIGITLTNSGLMVPQKSVTAIVGISDVPQAAPKNKCVACHMFDYCSVRKENHSCELSYPNHS